MRFALLTLLLVCLTMPAVALGAVPEPGAHYRVSGVAQNDQLNVRNQPGIRGEISGAFMPNAANIVVTGSRQSRDGSDWWEVLYPGAEGGTAWVNAHFLAPETPSRAQDTNYPLICTGTEPFWSLLIAARHAKYSTAGSHDQIFAASAWQAAHGAQLQFAIRLRKPTGAGGTGYAVIIRNPSCSDGMSDRLNPFSGIIILPDGQVFGGCCQRTSR